MSRPFDARPFLRLGLRRSLLQSGRSRQEVRRVLRDDDLFEATVVKAEQMVQNSGERFESPAEFLRFLLDNIDEIIAFIEKIIALFDSGTVSMTMPMEGMDTGPVRRTCAVPEVKDSRNL